MVQVYVLEILDTSNLVGEIVANYFIGRSDLMKEIKATWVLVYYV